MADIITGSGSYRTVDGRRVEIVCNPGEAWVKATNLNCMRSFGNEQRSINAPQTYRRDGTVVQMRAGEENDRIIGVWNVVPEPGHYITRDGRRARVTRVADDIAEFTIAGDPFVRYVFSRSGCGTNGKELPNDIVGPWIEPEPTSPVQEVTERRIVPGVYGIVGISLPVAMPNFNVWIPTTAATPEQLRDAARILNELADFIDS